MSKNENKSVVAVAEKETVKPSTKAVVETVEATEDDTKKMVVHLDRKVGADFKVLAELVGKSQISLVAELIESYTDKNKEAIDNYMKLRSSIKNI